MKRNQVKELIEKESQQKAIVEKNIEVLNGKLNNINLNLDKYQEVYESYNITIHETEKGFKKVH